MNNKSIVLLHKSGSRYMITDIPIREGKEGFQIEFQLQKMIDDIERLRKPSSKYSLIHYLEQSEV